MKIAIVGGGYSGLGACWHLLDAGHEVTVFDWAQGASQVSTGLLHPFPGEKMRRSMHAAEAMEETKKLLDVAEKAVGRKVCDRNGIRRIVHDPKLTEELKRRGDSDLVWKGGNEFFIASGITVFSSLYLKGLKQACTARFEQRKIAAVEELKEFDQILVAAGAGSLGFFPELKEEVTLIKGQVLSAKIEEEIAVSLLGKGYVAKREEQGVYHLGATYERGFTSEAPDEAFARKEIVTKIGVFYPEIAKAVIEGCKAAVRVATKVHYLPILRRIDERTSLITAMGSRGLLYHAYYGKLFKNLLLGYL